MVHPGKELIDIPGHKPAVAAGSNTKRFDYAFVCPPPKY
jgi:hypothetical protein